VDGINESIEAYILERETPLAREVGNIAHAIASLATAFDEIALALNRIADTLEAQVDEEDD
jgi:hypothetical protein